MTECKNWRLKKDDDRVLWLTFDRANNSVNAFNRDVLEELDAILENIKNENLNGLILQSGKENGFIAGADIEQFDQIHTANDAIAVMRSGQKIFDKLEQLRFPTLAMIKGFCMGGGTEIALACKFRIACDDDTTQIALPEVKLGIHPGWGGTVRMPRLIGAMKAMDLILSGRSLRASAAAKMGVVDAIAPLRHLEKAAKQFIMTNPARHRASLLERLTNMRFVRPLLGKVFYKQVAKKARREHYPAPYAVIKNWVRDGAQGQKAYISEANTAGELLIGSTARNLVRVFFLQERMKNLGKGVDFQPQHIHVIGAGIMGGDIAAWCAYKGYTVTLQDREPKYIAPAVARAYKLLQKKLKKPLPIRKVMDRFIPDPQGYGVEKADLIIEAIFENLEAKQALFKDLERRAKSEAILATNTSSIPLDEINQVMTNPGRLVGIHFFNPVAMMPLVEVVKGDKTEEITVKKALKFAAKLGKFPVAVKSKPGFLVNRCLLPYMVEAMHLLNEGAAAPAIDEAAVKFGMPMGPIELADTVGLDVCLSVVKNLTAAFGGEVPKELLQMVEKGNLGKKSGKGYYEYKEGKAVKMDTGIAPKDAVSRMMGRMLNECVACWREGVIEDTDLLDGGMIFGTGFAPFRGGPIKYIRDRGVAEVKKELEDLASKYGERFTPDAGWNNL